MLPLCLFALGPLVRGPIFASSDGILHVYQLVEFDSALRQGVLLPRWAPDMLAGYGYPLFIFYAPVMYYLAAGFHAIGLSLADAIKAPVEVGVLASALGMYVLGRDLWGRWGGLIAAAAYVYTPYRFVNTYLDGELSQTLAWAWLPWLFWACWRLLTTRRSVYGLLATVCYAGLIYTHSVTSWLATIFLGLWLLGLLALRQARLLDELRLAGWLGLGTGLAAPYWLPALAEQADLQLYRVQSGSYDFHNNLLPLAQVLSNELVHGYTGYVGVNGPAQLGLVQTLAAFAGLVGVLVFGRTSLRLGKSAAPFACVFAALVVVGVVLMLSPAAGLWDHVPFSRSLQFPDRILGILALPLALLAGGVSAAFKRLPRKAAIPACLVVAGALAYAATAGLDLSYVALPATFTPGDVVASEQSTGAIATTAKGEYTPKWMAEPALTSPLVKSYLTGEAPTYSTSNGVRITELQRGAEDLRFRVSTPTQAAVDLPLVYYPGWTATTAGHTLTITPGAGGLVSVPLLAGDSEVALHLTRTADQQLAEALGLLSVGLLAAIGVWSVRRQRPGLPAAVRGALGAVAAGGAVLALGLAILPGRIDVASWPATQPALVSYSGWLQFMGADVRREDDMIHVSTIFRTGAAQSARPVTATVRLVTKETAWASTTQTIPVEGWISAVPRRVDFDLPLAAGTPSGVYLLELQLRREDGSSIPPDWVKLTYNAPRVGPVMIGPVTLSEPIAGDEAASGLRDFGALELVTWRPPAGAEQGQLVPLDMTWRVKQQPSSDWGISLHVVDDQSRTWAGHDDRPRLGYNPTWLWQPDELQRDVQMVLLPGGMPPGAYTVLAGWYDVARKTAVGPQNVVVGRMSVAPSREPNPVLLDIPHRLSHHYAEGLELIGYDLPATKVVAGESLPLRLFWRADQQPAQDYDAVVSLDGHSQTVPLSATSRWQPGQLMETRFDVRTDPSWAGTGPLSVSLTAASDTFTIPESVTIESPPRLTLLPSGLSQVTPNRLGEAELAGYREQVQGGKLHLSLYWRPLGAVPPNLSVFVHALDPENHVVAQHDGIPGAGRRPTSTWTPAEYVEDVHDLELPPAPLPLTIEVGLYDPASGKRLGDRLLLQPVTPG